MHASEITFRNHPFWYDVGLDGHDLTVTVSGSVHLQLLGLLTREAPVIAEYEEVLKDEGCGFGTFIGPESSPWGFGPVLKCARSDATATTWWLPIPGADGGSPRERPHWNAVVRTLSILFWGLDLLAPDENPENKGRFQLVQIGMAKISEEKRDAYPLSADLTPRVAAWMRSENLTGELRAHLANNMTKTMRCVFFSVLGKPDDPTSVFRTDITDRALLLQVPGEQCTLSSEHSGDASRGLAMHPHNVDHAAQQLALLAGVSCFIQALRALGL